MANSGDLDEMPQDCLHQAASGPSGLLVLLFTFVVWEHFSQNWGKLPVFDSGIGLNINS